MWCADLLERRISAISREFDGSLSRSRMSTAGLRLDSSPMSPEVLISGETSILRPRCFNEAAFRAISSCQERSLTVFIDSPPFQREAACRGFFADLVEQRI